MISSVSYRPDGDRTENTDAVGSITVDMIAGTPMRTPVPPGAVPVIDTSPVLLWMVAPLSCTVAVKPEKVGMPRLPVICTEPPGPASPSAVVRVSIVVLVI